MGGKIRLGCRIGSRGQYLGLGVGLGLGLGLGTDLLLLVVFAAVTTAELTFFFRNASEFNGELIGELPKISGIRRGVLVINRYQSSAGGKQRRGENRVKIHSLTRVLQKMLSKTTADTPNTT